jgi:hypothetical protein
VSQTRDDREQLLVDAFVGLADTLVDDYDVVDVLDRLVAHSMTLLTADAAGILLVDPDGRLRVVASSSEESDWTELMQIQADEGPGVDCVRTGQPITVTDLDQATLRWPRSPPPCPAAGPTARCTPCPCGCAGNPSAG